MKGIRIVSLCFILLISCVVPGIGQVTKDNVHQYLESGELSYTIEINFSRIAWNTEAENIAEIEKVKKELQKDPENLSKVMRYIAVCNSGGRHDLSTAAAEQYFWTVQQAYKERQNETTARRLMIAANEIGPREAYITAYEAVRPFLELGDAELETVYAALDNRELVEDYQLGFRIAEFYQKIYPYEAELFFRGFLMTLNNSLYRTIPFMVQAIHEQMDTMDQFLLEYYRALEDAVYLDLLDKAVELEPDNYQYLLSSVGFRALVRWFSQLSTIMVDEGTTIGSIQDIFNSLQLQQDDRFREDLQKALQVRPEHDNQVFLAAALFQTTLGNKARAREYVEKALQIRPDLPEAYDAEIFLEMLTIADQDFPPSPVQRQTIEAILRAKMEESGKTAYDLYVLSALRLLTIRDGVSNKDKGEIATEMELYARESLELEDTLLGRIALGNALLLQNKQEEAVKQYSYAKEMNTETLRYAAAANLGVAYLLQGKTKQGKAEIEAAIEMFDGSLKAEPLLYE